LIHAFLIAVLFVSPSSDLVVSENRGSYASTAIFILLIVINAALYFAVGAIDPGYVPLRDHESGQLLDTLNDDGM